MSKKNDAGPAFPQPAIYDPIREKVYQASAYGCDAGMTLRDYFAAKALQGMVASEYAARLDLLLWAEHAYAMADAMLEERQK